MPANTSSTDSQTLAIQFVSFARLLFLRDRSIWHCLIRNARVLTLKAEVFSSASSGCFRCLHQDATSAFNNATCWTTLMLLIA